MFAVGLLSGLPALAVCVPNEFPDNWLQDQEAAGGHTIARHVGKTDAWLVDRYNTNQHISGASTYASDATAIQHIRGALALRRVAYNAWEPGANVGARSVYTTNMNATVGRGVHTPAPRPATVDDVHNQAQVITVMEKTGAGVCLLLTSYPTP